MRKITLLILFTFILSSCWVDESFENKTKPDEDDLNIIKKIWNQSLDKAIKKINTRTHSS
jgi:hypothetical protein